MLMGEPRGSSSFLKPIDEQVSEANLLEASYSLVVRTWNRSLAWEDVSNTAISCSFILSARLPTLGM